MLFGSINHFLKHFGRDVSFLSSKVCRNIHRKRKIRRKHTNKWKTKWYKSKRKHIIGIQYENDVNPINHNNKERKKKTEKKTNKNRASAHRLFRPYEFEWPNCTLFPLLFNFHNIKRKRLSICQWNKVKLKNLSEKEREKKM